MSLAVTTWDYAVRDFTDVWRDQLGDVGQGAKVAAKLVLEEYRDTPFLAYFARHDRDDELHLTYQLNHDWSMITPVRFHLHYEPMVAPASVSANTVLISGRYCWSVPHQPTPEWSGWTTFSTPLTIPTSGAFTNYVGTVFEATPPAGATASSILEIFMVREGTSLTDTYTASKADHTATANLRIKGVDVHYRATRAGTRGEYS